RLIAHLITSSTLISLQAKSIIPIPPLFYSTVVFCPEYIYTGKYGALKAKIRSTVIFLLCFVDLFVLLSGFQPLKLMPPA
ncbi:MAG: hypothetical protein PHT13_09815, partial [Methanosarcina sp.]|nr:hypothetical protein [Methanosarcina sp.]